MRTILMAGVAALALSAVPAFAGVSVPVAVNGSQAATNGGANVSHSANNAGNTSVFGSGNGDTKTVDSNNHTDTTISPSTTGSDSATAALGGLAVVNDTNLSQTTTKVATSVVDGSVHNSAPSVYVPFGHNSGMSNSLGFVGGTGIIQVQQNTAAGALQQQSVALGSVVGSGSGIGNSR
jgi:hypothetical protein